MKKFEKWLDTMIEEKGIDLEETFEIQGECWNLMSYGVVVETIKATSEAEQKAIQNMMVRIDFVNGDIKDYLRHLAKAIAY